MATPEDAADHLRRRAAVRNRLQDVSAGAMCSVIGLVYSLSYATLIFTGSLSNYLGTGIGLTLLSASIGALLIGLRSSIPFAVAGPDSSTSAVMAALVVQFVHRLPLTATTDDLLTDTIVIMAFATALTGVALLVFGLTHAGRAIRFIPYPVIGGFLGATGWLIIIGAAQVTTGEPFAISNLSVLLDPAAIQKLSAAIVIAIAFFAARRRWRSSVALPGLAVLAVLAVHLVLLALGIRVDEAQGEGWMFKPQMTPHMVFPWQTQILKQFPWELIPTLSGDLLSVMFVTAITMLFNTTGVELATKIEANLDQEFKAHGLANVVAASAGGFISCISVSRSTLNYVAGASSRLSAVIVSAVLAAVSVSDPSFLGYVPKCVLGGLLFYLGSDLLYRWIIQSSRRLAALEYLSLLAIALIIVRWGFVSGLVLGVVIGCATFALSASRIPAIKYSFDGSEFHSSLDRSPEDLTILAAHGQELQGMSLQGYLFFGSVSRLYDHIKALLSIRPGCRFLLFDFRLVTGIDSSAINGFRQIKQTTDKFGIRVVFVNMAPEIQSAFRITGLAAENLLVVPDLDHALEFCENAIIRSYKEPGSDTKSLRDWFTQVLGADHADSLAKECQRLNVESGNVIAKQGEPADSMHFILDGRVSIFITLPDGHQVRVRSLGRHTTVGEMGLITGQARSATIKADVASILYVLKVEAFERIRRDNPSLCLALLRYVIMVMAERLSFANRAIGILRR
jgi:sulfate permease, SulP family